MEKKIVDQFELEELEKRFEMGWGEAYANNIRQQMGVHIPPK